MSESTTRLRVKCLDHVTIVVKDLEASRRFYVECLGMDEVERPGFKFDGLWFQADQTQIHLILEHDDSGPAGLSSPERPVSSRTHHFAFEVEDSHAAAAHCREMGVTIIHDPKPRPDGAVQTFVQDPDGHIVELCSPPGS